MNALIEALNGAGAAWWTYLLHATWQSSLVAGVILTAAWLGRRWPARLRYGLVLIALVKFAMPPLLALPSGLFSRVGPTIVLEDGEAGPGLSPGGMAAETAAASPPERQPATMSWRAWLLLGHAAGSLAVAAWVIAQLTGAGRLSRRAREATAGPLHDHLARLSRQMGLRRPVRLLICPEPVPPMAFGLLRPTVMLPVSALHHLRPRQVKVILAHELAHHRRADLWVNCLQVFLVAAWWFNPLLWMVNRLVRKTREDCCDDLLLSRDFTSGPEYCEALLTVASGLGRSARLAAAAGFAERLHPLGERMRRIMDPRLPRRRRLSWATLPLLIVVAALVFPGLRTAPGVGPEVAGRASPAGSPEAAAADNGQTTPRHGSARAVAAGSGRVKLPGERTGEARPGDSLSWHAGAAYGHVDVRGCARGVRLGAPLAVDWPEVAPFGRAAQEQWPPSSSPQPAERARPPGSPGWPALLAASGLSAPGGPPDRRVDQVESIIGLLHAPGRRPGSLALEADVAIAKDELIDRLIRDLLREPAGGSATATDDAVVHDVAPIVPLNVYSPSMRFQGDFLGPAGVINGAFDIVLLEHIGTLGPDLIAMEFGDVQSSFLVSGCLLRPRPVPAPAAIWPLAMGGLVLLRRRGRAG